MDARTESEPTPVKNLTTVERKSEREFVVTRTFNGPARLVFEAWTKPELLKRWWVPKSIGMSLVSCEADVRVGGKYRFVFGLDGSKTMAFFGKYLEVTPHSRLVWTNEEGEGGEAVTTVTFEEKGGKTLLVLHERPSIEGGHRRGHRLRGGAARDVRATGRASRHRWRQGTDMGLLTFGLNVTLDGCYDHREGIADDELHDYFTQLIGAAGAMLYGRTTYEMMEAYWPAVARDEKAPRADREFARTLDAIPKYVVSASRRDFPWNNTFRVEGELYDAVRQLKEKTPRGLLVGSPMLSAALERQGLIDEYRIVVHPVIAGHGPTLFQGLERSRRLEVVSTTHLKSGVMALHCRRHAG